MKNLILHGHSGSAFDKVVCELWGSRLWRADSAPNPNKTEDIYKKSDVVVHI